MFFSPLSLPCSLSLFLHALFIYLHQWIQNSQSNVISIHMKMILKMPILPIIQCNYKSVFFFFYRIFNQWGDPWEGKYLIYALFQNLASCLRRRHCERLQRVGNLIMVPCFSQILRQHHVSFVEKAISECTVISVHSLWKKKHLKLRTRWDFFFI